MATNPIGFAEYAEATLQDFESVKQTRAPDTCRALTRIKIILLGIQKDDSALHPQNECCTTSTTSLVEYRYI